MKIYYDYSKVNLKEEYIIDNDGFKNGYYKSYYANKMPNEIGQYKKDLKTGLWKTFDPDGKLNATVLYKEGQNDGLYQQWINGTGFHYLGADHYYDMDKEIRTVSYYPNGAIQSDIRKDGDCFLTYKNGKLAKKWLNKNFTQIDTSVRIWTKDGTTLNINKKIGNTTYHFNYDVDYDYSGNSDQNDYYIKQYSKIVADSAEWKIEIVPSTKYQNSFVIERERNDTLFQIIYSLKIAENSNKYLDDLKFLNSPDVFIKETASSIRDTTTIEIYDENRNIIQKNIGLNKASVNEPFSFAKQLFAVTVTFDSSKNIKMQLIDTLLFNGQPGNVSGEATDNKNLKIIYLRSENEYLVYNKGVLTLKVRSNQEPNEGWKNIVSSINSFLYSSNNSEYFFNGFSLKISNDRNDKTRLVDFSKGSQRVLTRVLPGSQLNEAKFEIYNKSTNIPSKNFDYDIIAIPEQTKITVSKEKNEFKNVFSNISAENSNFEYSFGNDNLASYLYTYPEPVDTVYKLMENNSIKRLILKTEFPIAYFLSSDTTSYKYTLLDYEFNDSNYLHSIEITPFENLNADNDVIIESIFKDKNENGINWPVFNLLAYFPEVKNKTLSIQSGKSDFTKSLIDSIFQFYPSIRKFSFQRGTQFNTLTYQRISNILYKQLLNKFKNFLTSGFDEKNKNSYFEFKEDYDFLTTKFANDPSFANFNKSFRTFIRMQNANSNLIHSINDELLEEEIDIYLQNYDRLHMLYEQLSDNYNGGAEFRVFNYDFLNNYLDFNRNKNIPDIEVMNKLVEFSLKYLKKTNQ